MILSKGHVKVPMQSVFYSPMTTNIGADLFHSLSRQTAQIVLFFMPFSPV